MKKLNITITGGKGFIGSHLWTELPGLVHVWDLKGGNNIFDENFEEEIKNSDVVYHLAALTSVNQSFKNPDQVFITNVLGTARVAYLCAKYKKKLIYPSSAAIYHKELSPYAYSKYLAEEIVKGIMNTTPVVILRLYNVFGEGMNKESGSIMYNFLHDKKIVIYGDGEQTRDFIHVRDVVSVMKDALKSRWNGKIVDVGTGEATSINYVAGMFAYARKLKVKYKPLRREIRWSIANDSMLKTLHKQKLTTDLEEDILKLCKS